MRTEFERYIEDKILQEISDIDKIIVKVLSERLGRTASVEDLQQTTMIKHLVPQGFPTQFEKFKYSWNKDMVAAGVFNETMTFETPTDLEWAHICRPMIFADVAGPLASDYMAITTRTIGPDGKVEFNSHIIDNKEMKEQQEIVGYVFKKDT